MALEKEKKYITTQFTIDARKYVCVMLHPSQPSDFNCYSVQMNTAHSYDRLAL